MKEQQPRSASIVAPPSVKREEAPLPAPFKTLLGINVMGRAFAVEAVDNRADVVSRKSDKPRDSTPAGGTPPAGDVVSAKEEAPVKKEVFAKQDSGTDEEAPAEETAVADDVIGASPLRTSGREAGSGKVKLAPLDVVSRFAGR